MKTSGFTHLILLIVIVAIVVLAGGFFILSNRSELIPPTETACTLEAKLCPDGSSVGRQGPNCEFAECPAPTSTVSPTQTPSNSYKSLGIKTDISEWKTYTNKGYGYSIKYPEYLAIEAFNSESSYLPSNSEQYIRISSKSDPNVALNIEIDVPQNEARGSFEQWKKRSISDAYYTVLSVEDVLIDGQKGKLVTGKDNKYKLTNVFYEDPTDTNFFYIGITTKPGDDSLDDIFETIGATFKFTN